LANVKQSTDLVLVLLISMGLGVVKWTIGTTRIKIGLLAVFYMFFSFLYQTMREVFDLEKKEIVTDTLSLLVIIPLAFLTTSFAYWIFLSLIRTMQQLTLRRQVLKLQMYKTLFGVLVVFGVLSCLSGIYVVYKKIKGPEMSMSWRYDWMIEAFREILFFGILASIAVLWRPRSNNTRYGYAEFFTDEDNGDIEKVGSIPLETINVAGGELTRRKKKKQEQE